MRFPWPFKVEIIGTNIMLFNESFKFVLYILSKFGQKFPSDDFHIAIVAYTLNNVAGTPNRLYKDFNKASRDLTVDNFEDFKFKSLWYLLGFSIPQLANNPLPEDSLLYRGLHGFQYPATELRRAIRDETPIVLGTAFVSTSDKKSKAEEFAQNMNCVNCPHNKCFLIFKGRPNYGNCIKQHSVYPDEGEVLVCPWSQWIVTEATTKGTWQYVTLEPNRYNYLNLII